MQLLQRDTTTITNVQTEVESSNTVTVISNKVFWSLAAAGTPTSDMNTVMYWLNLVMKPVQDLEAVV
jgi:hypothetical protein